MKIDPRKRIGGGNGRLLQISVSGVRGKKKTPFTRVQKISARGGLFAGDLFIATKGPHQHKVCIPHWDNMLLRSAIDNGEYQTGCYDTSWLMYRVYTSVYEALRYTYWVLHGTYGITFNHGEKAQLRLAEAELIELNMIAAGLRKGNAEELGLVFAKKSATILQRIGEQPRDILKRQARVLSVSLVTVYDSIGRTNATVKMTRAAAARRRIRNRRANISCIEPVIIARRQTLKSVIEEMELYWSGMLHYLDLLFAEQFYAMSALQDPDTRKRIVQQLRFYRMEIARYDIEPFTRTAYHVHPELQQALTYISDEKYGGAKKILERIWNSTKLRKVRMELEHVLLQLTCSLFGRTSGVDWDVCAHVIFVCDEQAKVLSQVDEAGFDNPVAEKTLAYLLAPNGIVALLKQRKLRTAKKARELLKQAVAPL